MFIQSCMSSALVLKLFEITMNYQSLVSCSEQCKVKEVVNQGAVKSSGTHFTGVLSEVCAVKLYGEFPAFSRQSMAVFYVGPNCSLFISILLHNSEFRNS